MLLLLFAVIYAGYSLCDNHNAAYTQAIIVSSEPSGYAYFENANGTQEMYDEVTVEYLGEFLLLLFLLVTVPVVNIIVWIVAAVKYARKQAAKEVQYS